MSARAQPAAFVRHIEAAADPKIEARKNAMIPYHTPVIELSSDEEEDEEEALDAPPPKKKKKLDDGFLEEFVVSGGGMKQETGAHAAAEGDILEQQSYIQRDIIEIETAKDDEEEILAPDEKWQPEASGIVKYVDKSEEVDWVVVSQRRIMPVSPKPLRVEAPAVAIEENEMLEYPDFATDEDLEPEEAAGRVNTILQTFQKVRLRIIQEAEVKGQNKGQAAAKAGKLLFRRNVCFNRRKRIGHVPGVEVGQLFCFRFEVFLVGVHQTIQAGISSLGSKERGNKWGVLVACSIVLSGGYEDDEDDGETFVYTGQGGQDANNRQVQDQKLEGGNLALLNSFKLTVPVRVVRGTLEANSPSGRVYSYDGLYRIIRCWSEPGSSGFLVYKYSLKREPGQAELGSRLVRYAGKLRQRKEKRKSVVCDDISGGLEPVPVVAVNDVDGQAAPPGRYTYTTRMRYPAGFRRPEPPRGCGCTAAGCSKGDCRCVRRNNGKLPYNKDGSLLEWRPILYECGPRCGCGPDCSNRVSQRDNHRRFEVFKTVNRGWGVRCWEAIPYGSFVCEYVGEMIRSEEAEARVGKDEYIFDIDPIRGSKNRGVDVSTFFNEEESSSSRSEQQQQQLQLQLQQQQLVPVEQECQYSIDAENFGNFSRFINHSCNPNLFVQCVFNDHCDLSMPHIMMFASRHIRPFEELAYDYGYELGSVHDANGAVKEKACLCGARGCRRRLY